jgi:hypothetical protein
MLFNLAFHRVPLSAPTPAIASASASLRVCLSIIQYRYLECYEDPMFLSRRTAFLICDTRNDIDKTRKSHDGFKVHIWAHAIFDMLTLFRLGIGRKGVWSGRSAPTHRDDSANHSGCWGRCTLLQGFRWPFYYPNLDPRGSRDKLTKPLVGKVRAIMPETNLLV